jgi:hypothetical protein
MELALQRKEVAEMQILTQAWWAPFAALLTLAQFVIALEFFFADGTSNLLDAEGTAAGAALALGGTAALAAGLWIRPRAHGLGNAPIIVGAALGAIWFWAVVMTPIAIVVIVGAVVSQLRSTPRVTETP